MVADNTVSLWRLAAPDEVASILKRSYGPAACAEALWRLSCPDSAQDDNRAFWLAVLDQLGITGLAEVKLTPQIVAGFYAAHLDDPVRAAIGRVLEAMRDGDRRKEVFWSAVSNAILSICNASGAARISTALCEAHVRDRAE